jgi:peptidoglycan/xylan/chitin deacetylase (PgdA/CDA1 family)
MKAVMYHYVRNEDATFPSFKFLHFDDFRKQLDYFQDNYNVLHPDVLKQAVVTGKKADGIVLTFDDGLKDHYEYVLPELLRRGLSAIFYITTGIYESNKIFAVHRLHLLLGRFGSETIYHHLRTLVKDEMLSHVHLHEFRELTYTLQTNDEYTILVKRIMNYFISYEYRDGILDEMMKDFFGDENELFDSLYLNSSEIKKMYDAGMVIGSHTKTHPVLSKLSANEQDYEISSSFNYLENICINLPYRTFCYPYGGFYSFTNETENILKEARSLFSFNVEQRDISEDDLLLRPQALPRYDCNYFPFGQTWENKKCFK